VPRVAPALPVAALVVPEQVVPVQVVQVQAEPVETPAPSVAVLRQVPVVVLRSVEVVALRSVEVLPLVVVPRWVAALRSRAVRLLEPPWWTQQVCLRELRSWMHRWSGR